MAQKKASVPDPLANLKNSFNRAWSLVSLQRRTLQEVLDYLAIKPADLPPELVNGLDKKPSYDQFFKIKTWVLEQHGKPAVKFYETPAIWQPAIHDSLIESSFKHLTHREEVHELVKGILPPRNPKQKCTLFYFQQEAAEQVLHNLINLGYSGDLCRANTGDGKTYANGQVLRWLIDMKYHVGKTFSPYPYLYVTKASIVDQTTEDLTKEFGLDVPGDVLVLNYDALRATLGEMFIKEETIVQWGEEHTVYSWKPFVHPIVIVWDECQSLKNPGSLQTIIAAKYNSVKGEASKHIKQIFSSATPFSKVESAKCFCLSTRHLVSRGVGKVPLTEIHWPEEAAQLAQPAKPNEYSKAAIKNLLKKYDKYIVGFKNVRRKHKGINTEELIDFANKAEAEKYQKAWEEYLEAKAKIEGGQVENSGLLLLVEFLKFRQAAELIRAPTLAEKMHYAVEKKGKAALCATNFKPTIAKGVMTLNQKFGVPRSKISIIWGGDASLDSKSKWTKEEIKSLLLRAAKGEEVKDKDLKEILKQLQMEAAGLGEIPAELELGIQSRKQRWEEIKRFQDGESLYCFFTFGAGGAGLSLHHKYPHTRPRETYVSPTYNEMELNQALGRAPRLTSLSDTIQKILLYRGTVEVAVLHRVNQKSQCLTEVISHSEVDDSLVKQVMELAGANVNEEEDDDLGHEVFEEHENETNEN